MKRVHHRHHVGGYFGGSLVPGETVHRDHLHGPGKLGGLGGQPTAQRRPDRPAPGQAAVPDRLVRYRDEVDDQRDKPLDTASPRRPAVLVDPDHPHLGQSIRAEGQ